MHIAASENGVRAVVNNDGHLMKVLASVEHREIQIEDGEGSGSGEPQGAVVDASLTVAQHPLCSHHFVVGCVAKPEVNLDRLFRGPIVARNLKRDHNGPSFDRPPFTGRHDREGGHRQQEENKPNQTLHTTAKHRGL